MRNWITVPTVMCACLLATPLAMAQNVGAYAPPVSWDQAQEIAVVNGVIAIRKIEFDDGNWKVEGRDRAGRRVEMRIHPRTGEIEQLERYD